MATYYKNNILISLFFIVYICVGLLIISVLDDKYFSSGAIVFSSLLALSAAIVNISYTRKTARENNSLSFQQSLLNSKLYHEKVRCTLEAISNRHQMSLDKYAEDEFANAQEAEAIRYVLNTWEQAANAIRHNIYDDLYLYKSHKSSVLYLGVILRGYIRKKQQVNASYFQELNWLILKWSIRRDSFSEKKTKKKLKKIFRELDKVKTGKISPSEK